MWLVCGACIALQTSLPKFYDTANVSRFVQRIILDPVMEYCTYQSEQVVEAMHHIRDEPATSGELTA